MAQDEPPLGWRWQGRRGGGRRAAGRNGDSVDIGRPQAAIAGTLARPGRFVGFGGSGRLTALIDSGGHITVVDRHCPTALLDSGGHIIVVDSGRPTAFVDSGRPTAFVDSGRPTAFV